MLNFEKSFIVIYVIYGIYVKLFYFESFLLFFVYAFIKSIADIKFWRKKH